jgi:hypothetical protein
MKPKSSMYISIIQCGKEKETWKELQIAFTKSYWCYCDNVALYVLTIIKNVLKRVNASLISLRFAEIWRLILPICLHSTVVLQYEVQCWLRNHRCIRHFLTDDFKVTNNTDLVCVYLTFICYKLISIHSSHCSALKFSSQSGLARHISVIEMLFDIVSFTLLITNNKI